MVRVARRDGGDAERETEKDSYGLHCLFRFVLSCSIAIDSTLLEGTRVVELNNSQLLVQCGLRRGIANEREKAGRDGIETWYSIDSDSGFWAQY